MTAEGRSALTMQRVTDELGTSVGGIYLYFPTKDALLAELEADALQVLDASYRLGQARLDAHLAARALTAEIAALARAVATARFWIDAGASLPTELDLARRSLGDARAAALHLLDDVQARLAAAAAEGGLDADDDRERAVLVVAAVNGVLSASQAAAWDEERFDGRRLARRLVDVLFLGWGASREHLEAANRALDELGADDHLAPVPAPGGHDRTE